MIPIFHSFAKWQLSGVNTWSINLIRGIDGADFQSKVLFTGLPEQVHQELRDVGVHYVHLDLPAQRTRKQEWWALKVFLETNAPCIYIPNCDFHRSCAVGTLSRDVRVCAVVHSDEGCYYDELRRIGVYCDSIVCVSSYLERKVKERFPNLANRVLCIPHGVSIPEDSPASRPFNSELRMAYCNRLQQYQKRVFDLPLILDELRRLQVPFHLTIAGEGPDSGTLADRMLQAGLAKHVTFLGRVSNHKVMEVLRMSHAFLLTSDFEGLPISMLEAMSVGCIPVVYQIESGINDAIEDGVSGMKVPHGDTKEFARRLQSLNENVDLRIAIERNAISATKRLFSIERMSHDYTALFHRLVDGETPPALRDGRVQPPFDITLLGKMSRRFKRLVKRG